MGGTEIDVDAVHAAGKDAADFADTVNSQLGTLLGTVLDVRAFGPSQTAQQAGTMVTSVLNDTAQMLQKSLGAYLTGISQRLEAVTKSSTATEKKNVFKLNSADQGGS